MITITTEKVSGIDRVIITANDFNLPVIGAPDNPLALLRLVNSGGDVTGYYRYIGGSWVFVGYGLSNLNESGSGGSVTIINDPTFATATISNVPSAESVKAYVDAHGGATVSTQLTDMPSTMLNKAGKALVSNPTEDANTYADLSTGFYNLKPQNYLRTRAALADVYAGLNNMQLLYWTSDDGELQEDFVRSYKYSLQMCIARVLSQNGIPAGCQNFLGASNGVALSAVNANDTRVSNLPPAWTNSPSPGGLRGNTWVNTTTTDPFIYRPQDASGLRTAAGSAVTTDTIEVFYEDAVTVSQDTGFVVKGGTIGAGVTITGITKANPGVLNIPAHGRTVGDLVLLECAGMTQFASLLVFVNNVIDTNFVQVRLTGVASGGASVDTSTYATFTSGTMKPVTLTNATVVSQVHSGGNVVRKGTFTLTGGAQVWTIQKSATDAKRLCMLGVNCLNVATKQVNILRAGNWLIDSFNQTTWNATLGIVGSTDTNSGIMGGSATIQSKTPLTIIALGLGEANYGFSTSTVLSRLNTTIAAIKSAGGEVMIQLDWERAASSTTIAKADAVKYGAYQAAYQNDVALIDVRALRGNATAQTNAGLLGSSGVRPTSKGNMDMANIVVQALARLCKPSDVYVKDNTSNFIPNKLSVATGNFAVDQSFFGSHTTPQGVIPSNYAFGTFRAWDGGKFEWRNIEAVQGVYDFTTFDAQVLDAWSKGITRFMLTLGFPPPHAVNQTWYNGITAQARSTAYSVNDVRRPAAGNGCIYKCTTAGTTAASAPTYPTTYPTSVTDGSSVWTLIVDAYQKPTGNFPYEPSRVAALITAVINHYNKVSTFNPQGLRYITDIESHNEPTFLSGPTDVAIGYDALFYKGTAQTCVDAQGAITDVIYALDPVVRVWSPGFTGDKNWINLFMNATESTGANRRGCQLVDNIGSHPYGRMTSPNNSDILEDTGLGANVILALIASNPAGVNFRGNSVQTLGHGNTEWGMTSGVGFPDYNAWNALTPNERFKRLLRTYIAAWAGKYLVWCHYMTYWGDIVGDTQGVLLALSTAQNMIGAGVTIDTSKIYRYIDGTGRWEVTINGVTTVV